MGFGEGAYGEHGLPAGNTSSHAGALHALFVAYLVGGFDREDGALGFDPAALPVVEPELFKALAADWRMVAAGNLRSVAASFAGRPL